MSSASQPVRITNHAKIRWQQRGTLTLSVTEAWDQGVHVGLATHCGTVRLHPPTGTLLLERDNQIITVVQCDNAEYTADHLLNCEDCGFQFQPSADDHTCPWCEYDNKIFTND
jgi:hypothetical protein